MTSLVSRILALPAHEQAKAVEHFRRLVETRQAELPPKDLVPVELARENPGRKPFFGPSAFPHSQPGTITFLVIM